jgi:hypothetical protein
MPFLSSGSFTTVSAQPVACDMCFRLCTAQQHSNPPPRTGSDISGAALSQAGGTWEV